VSDELQAAWDKTIKAVESFAPIPGSSNPTEQQKFDLYRTQLDRPISAFQLFRAGFHLGQASRPPAPAWTSEPPRVAGWYWVDYGRGVTTTLVTSECLKMNWGYGRWAGPIPEPPA
jgi:hypothetical protein